MKSVYSIAVMALISTQAVQLEQHQNMHAKHACDFIKDDGDEISTSLMPEYVQLNDDEATTTAAAPQALAEDDVASTREKF